MSFLYEILESDIEQSRPTDTVCIGLALAKGPDLDFIAGSALDLAF